MFSSFFLILPFMRKCNVEKCVKLGRPQMTIWRMRIRCWIPKSTNTHAQTVMQHCNNGYTNAPQCCVIRISPAWYVITFL